VMAEHKAAVQQIASLESQISELEQARTVADQPASAAPRTPLVSDYLTRIRGFRAINGL
jgi:hypothetical protein